MSLDSRLRLARKNGAGVNLRHFEVPTIVEALTLLRACERAEAKGPLPAPPFPAFIARELVEAELRATLETGRDRIVELGGDCDPVDRMLEGAMHSLDMRAQSKARDDANPVDDQAAAVRQPAGEPSFEGMIFDAHLPSMTARFRIPPGLPFAAGMYQLTFLRSPTDADQAQWSHLPEPPDEDAAAERVAAAAGDLVKRHASRLGMDAFAAAELERAVRALGGEA